MPSPAVRFSAEVVTLGWSGVTGAWCAVTRGIPFREEVTMAAEESAQVRRWSATTTNVDDDVLEQTTYSNK